MISTTMDFFSIDDNNEWYSNSRFFENIFDTEYNSIPSPTPHIEVFGGKNLILDMEPLPEIIRNSSIDEKVHEVDSFSSISYQRNEESSTNCEEAFLSSAAPPSPHAQRS